MTKEGSLTIAEAFNSGSVLQSCLLWSDYCSLLWTGCCPENCTISGSTPTDNTPFVGTKNVHKMCVDDPQGALNSPHGFL